MHDIGGVEVEIGLGGWVDVPDLHRNPWPLGVHRIQRAQEILGPYDDDFVQDCPLVANGVTADALAQRFFLNRCERSLSFQGARQVVQNYRAEMATASVARAEELRADALAAIAGERVGDRPDRYEPRARKRREKMYPRLQVPRRVARKRLARAG